MGYTVKKVRLDNGGEYVGEDIYQYLTEQGMLYQPGPPYSPESDGVTERMNRTLIEKVRAILVDSGLPPGL